jgi:RNase_H superfamily
MSRTKDQWLKETGGFPLKALLFAQLASIPKHVVKPGVKATIFDIETQPIARTFSFAKTARQRTKSAPDPSIACAYSASSKRYTFYEPHEFPALLRLLQSSDEVVSFNGEAFDFHVLAKTTGVSMRHLNIKSSVDLFRIVADATGKMASLNNLALVNLGRGKHTAGHLVPQLDAKSIKAACKSDVKQTFELYKLYRAGELKAPLLSLSRKHYAQMPFRGVCPVCKDVASIVEITHELSRMTDGQYTDYLSGNYGTLRCTSCNTTFTWGM